MLKLKRLLTALIRPLEYIRQFSGSWLWLGAAIFLLSSCAFYSQFQEKSAQRKACFAHCEQRCFHCDRVCDDNAKLCAAKSDTQAAVHFVLNRHQQMIKGQVVVTDMASFRDPLACMKTTCNCEKDKKMCKQVCRGKIYKRLQSAILLNKRVFYDE